MLYSYWLYILQMLVLLSLCVSVLSQGTVRVQQMKEGKLTGLR